jgi:hypothetical protein
VLQNCRKTLFANNIAAQSFGAILCEKNLALQNCGKKLFANNMFPQFCGSTGMQKALISPNFRMTLYLP